MSEFGTIVAVVVGGAISLLGTLLAHFLQYRSEREARKRERRSGRMAEVRGWLICGLELADLVCNAGVNEEGVLEGAQYRGWVKSAGEWHERVGSLAVKGSALVLSVEDDALARGLNEFNDGLQRMLRHAYWVEHQRMVPQEAVDDRDELVRLGSRVQALCDDLADAV